MLTRLNSGNNFTFFSVQSRLSSRTRMSSKVLPSRSKKVGAKMSRRKTKKPKNKSIRQSSRGFAFTEELGKQLITEIQYSAYNTALQSPNRKIFNEEQDKSMEIVDGVVEEEKTPKTVKFEHNLEPSASQSTQGSQNSLRGFASKLRKSGYRSATAKNKLNKTSVIKNAKRGSKFTSYKRCKVNTSSTNQEIVSKSYGLDSPKPGSVTSQFTACSVGKNQGFKAGRKAAKEPSGWTDAASESQDDQEREIIQAIEEKLTFKEENESKFVRGRFQRSSPNKKKIFRNMYLITEIESDQEMSRELIKDKSMGSASYKDSPMKSSDKASTHASEFHSEDINFKSNQSTREGVMRTRAMAQRKVATYKTFKLYNESNVISYKGIQPKGLPYNLTKGDDDEDSESEDVKSGKRYLQLHLENALSELAKPKKKYYYY